MIDADSGLIKRTADVFGNTVEFTEDGIRSDSGVEIDFAYDTSGRVSKITDVDGSAVEYRYNALGDLAAFIDQEGNVTEYEYSNSRPHFLEEIIDPLGRPITKNSYDENGRLISVEDASGSVSQFEFDPESNIETVTDALGFSTIFEYDGPRACDHDYQCGRGNHSPDF